MRDAAFSTYFALAFGVGSMWGIVYGLVIDIGAQNGDQGGGPDHGVLADGAGVDPGRARDLPIRIPKDRGTYASRLTDRRVIDQCRPRLRRRTIGQRMADQRPALVGRGAELAFLRRLLDDDGPVVAFVHGIGGVGKSALVEAFGRRPVKVARSCATDRRHRAHDSRIRRIASQTGAEMVGRSRPIDSSLTLRPTRSPTAIV